MTIPDSTGGAALEVHRVLDEALAGTAMTPERQDLKEEIRANLVARVAELRAQGLSSGQAARRAVEDLGDLRGLIEGIDPAAGRAAPPQGPDVSPGRWLELERAHRVRPRPAFVVRTVLLAAVAVAALAVLALAAVPVHVPLAGRLVAVVAAALAAAGTTRDALRQETTGNYPMPPARATGYAAAAGLGVLALATGWQYTSQQAPGWLVAAVVLLLAGVVLGVALFATQTNRRKAWVLELAAHHAHAGDRFTNDPAAAARFGIYTVVTWLVAAAAFVALTLTVGWAWSWTAVVAALAATMLTLARMLFGPPQG